MEELEVQVGSNFNYMGMEWTIITIIDDIATLVCSTRDVPRREVPIVDLLNAYASM